MKKSVHTVWKTLDILVHVDVMHPDVIVHQRKFIGHADDGTAQLSMNHIEVITPEVLELV